MGGRGRSTKYWKKLLLALLTIIVVVVVIVVSTSSTTKEDPNSAGSPTTQSPANDDKSSDAASDNDNESVLTLLPPFERILQRGHVVCGAATWPLSHDLVSSFLGRWFLSNLFPNLIVSQMSQLILFYVQRDMLVSCCCRGYIW